MRARLRLLLLAVWAAASFGCCFFARDLQFAIVGGWPANYWMAAQGAMLVFIGVVAVYAWQMNRLDAAAARAEAEAAYAQAPGADAS